MPLLQSIVQELDGELARLHSLRSIVAGLSRTPKVVAHLISSPVLVSKHVEALANAATPVLEQPKPPREPKAEAGKPRGRRTSKLKSSLEPRALAKNVPSGPVVFNPTRLAEEKAKREQSRDVQAPTEAVQTAEDLDALSRSLAVRWSTGPIQ